MSDLIYLDHAATTPVDEEVLEAMLPYLKDKFGSASTLYSIGRDAREAVEEARINVARLIGAQPEEIYFTSGGSESDNWAVFGVAAAKAKKGKHIIASKIEHHAILEPCQTLEKQGYTVTILDVDANGFIDMDRLASSITNETVLITIMHANNEIGTIEPVEEIGRLAKEKGIHFHSDTVQTAGHIPVNVDEMNCDSLAISAHKLYGPKGVGAMYIRKGARVERLMRGGGQENNKRAGTHNVPGIVGLGKAAELALKRMPEEAAHTINLRDALIEGIESRIKDVRLNGDRVKRVPNNVNFSFEGVEGESMILLMDMNGICVSSGSACTSGSLDPSHVLMALGLRHEQAHGSLRMTLGKDNTMAHIEKVLDTLPGIVHRLREMSPLYAGTN
ncbi:MAG: cysteine desulfurase NifS [Armatimonadetes bacterium]|nr:cysteine desulfurase NifS [Armatimonadota bacterium]